MNLTAPPDMAEAFRHVMAHVATPVSVVTTMLDNAPKGTTVSAFASLSMTPPMLLVSLGRESETLQAIRQTRRFGLNVLADYQANLALTFAKKSGSQKFDEIEWTTDGGMPRLMGVCGWVRCAAMSFVDGGDHVIVLGGVSGALHDDRSPMVYFKRSFGTHLGLPR